MISILDSTKVARELTGAKAVEDHLVVDIAGGTVVTPHESAKVGLVKAPIISSGECPTRYYQTCGNKGRDAWNLACPNYNQLLYDTKNIDETSGEKLSAILKLKFENSDTNALIDKGRKRTFSDLPSLLA